jgi:ATP-dependent protease Clp ATPase subunit
LTDAYYSDVARIASKEKLGARALKGIVERSLFYLMYNAPDFHKQGIRKIKFDKYPDKDYFPTAVYDNKEEELKEYKLYRGVDEKAMEQ